MRPGLISLSVLTESHLNIRSKDCGRYSNMHTNTALVSSKVRDSARRRRTINPPIVTDLWIRVSFRQWLSKTNSSTEWSILFKRRANTTFWPSIKNNGRPFVTTSYHKMRNVYKRSCFNYLLTTTVQGVNWGHTRRCRFRDVFNDNKTTSEGFWVPKYLLIVNNRLPVISQRQYTTIKINATSSIIPVTKSSCGTSKLVVYCGSLVVFTVAKIASYSFICSDELKKR